MAVVPENCLSDFLWVSRNVSVTQFSTYLICICAYQRELAEIFFFFLTCCPLGLYFETKHIILFAYTSGGNWQTPGQQFLEVMGAIYKQSVMIFYCILKSAKDLLLCQVHLLQVITHYPLGVVSICHHLDTHLGSPPSGCSI